MAAARHEGLKVAGSRIDVSQTAADYRPAVQRAMSSGADVIYFSTGIDGFLKGIQAGQELGFKGDYYATQFSGLIKGLGPLASQVDGRLFSAAFGLLPGDDTTHAPELAKEQAGMKQYQPAFAEDPTAVNGWAAGKMFADALTAVGPDRAKIIGWLSHQSAYAFGGLQGPMNYTSGSKPNPCSTRLEFKGGAIVRATSAAKPPAFNCGVLIDPSTGKVNG